MKRTATVLALGALTATTASAEGIVEITHKSLRPGSHAVIYWCIEKDEVPAEYSEPGRYVLMDRALDRREGGFYIAIQADTNVFLTTEACLDETLSLFSNSGGVVEDLTLTRK